MVEEIVIYGLFSDYLDEERKNALAQKLLSVPRPYSFRRGSPSLTQILLIEIQLWRA